MQFSILIHGEDGTFDRLPPETQEAVMQGHRDLQQALAARGPYATAKLMPASSAVTLNPVTELGQKPIVTDGPFADTKERFLGFYCAEFKDLNEAMEFAAYLASPYARIEVRPVSWAGGVLAMESADQHVA